LHFPIFIVGRVKAVAQNVRRNAQEVHAGDFLRHGKRGWDKCGGLPVGKSRVGKS